MKQPSKIADLIEAFCCLPGVGPRTAQRMVMHLLERDRDAGLNLSERLQEAMVSVVNCERCRNLCEDRLCDICADDRRQMDMLCVVETPADVMAIEQSGSYNGGYFVLLGHLSPIDGIGPEELGLDKFGDRLQGVREVIVATNSTVEGEATAHYISEMLAQTDIAVSRIAHGIPIGGELEFVDGGTLGHALSGRIRMNSGGER
ncbi:MAG: recombination mediator RecR [Gammaproteobacteria bacterium]|nr:recombination mediator RecR [Gammaproteobacteria bacterium]